MFQLDDTLVIASAPCGSKAYQPDDFPRTYAYTLHAATGDHFSALPASPTFSTRRVSGIGISGHWPSDVWLAYVFPPGDVAGAREQFHRWDGSRWNTVETAPFSVARREPHRIFDWFDGAKLVAQSRHWHNSVTYRVEPLLVWGKTTHPAPDFSRVEFPWYREAQNVRVTYDVSPNHEVFVTHVLTKERPDRTVITVARASAKGEVRSETVLDTAGFADARVALGRWGEREVAIAWGSSLRSVSSSTYRPWARVFEGSGATSTPFALPGPAVSSEDVTRLWLANGQVWVRRGPTVWRLQENQWVEHARVAVSARLTHASDGSMWGVDGSALMRWDTQGKLLAVPFLEAPGPAFAFGQIEAPAPDDVWLRASDKVGEELFFRTRPTKLLSCD